MNLSGRLIDAFLALEETRRFSIAAERCHLSSSAFSQAINRLEEAVGARLFDRNTRNVSLTPDGEVFLNAARRISAEIKLALREVSDRAGMRTGNVSIAAPTSVAATWLPCILADFKRDHPGVALRLDDPVADRRMNMLLQNEVDLVLNAETGNAQEFEAQFVLNERFYVIMRRDDPLARQESLKLKDLKRRIFLHTVQTGSVWPHVYPLVKQAEVRDTGFAVSSFSTLGALVNAGFGISIVPKSALPLCIGADLCSVLLAARGAVRPLYLVKRKDRSLSIAAQALWQTIASTLSSPPAD